MNVGFVEASLKHTTTTDGDGSHDLAKDFDCFIFHDVDLIPENDHNRYHCNDRHPVHMSVAVSSLGYRYGSRISNRKFSSSPPSS